MKNIITEIPDEYKIKPLACDEYLVDGQIKKWKGATSDVFSVIQTDGNPTLLGSIPDMETDSALEALDAAKTAFNRGQGLWPTMKVGERLKCMETFVEKMKFPIINLDNLTSLDKTLIDLQIKESMKLYDPFIMDNLISQKNVFSYDQIKEILYK